MLMQAKDWSIIGFLVVVLTFLGLVWTPVKKVVELDGTIGRVAALEQKVNDNAQKIAVTDSEFQQISHQLDQINWQLRRINK